MPNVVCLIWQNSCAAAPCKMHKRNELHTHTHTHIVHMCANIPPNTHTQFAVYSATEEKQLNFCLLLHMYVFSTDCVCVCTMCVCVSCPLPCPVSRPCGIFVKNCIIHRSSRSRELTESVVASNVVMVSRHRHRHPVPGPVMLAHGWLHRTYFI